jgi:hypothetical protein
MVKSITASLLSMCMARNPGLFVVLGLVVIWWAPDTCKKNLQE